MLSKTLNPVVAQSDPSRDPATLMNPFQGPARGSLARVKGMAKKMAPRQMTNRAAGARSPSLVIDVLVGIPQGKVAMATFPHILRGIARRAEMEIRERPELGSLKVGVYYQSPESFYPEAGCAPGFQSMRDNDRHGSILIYPFAKEAVAAVSHGRMAVSVLESYEGLEIDTIDTDEAKAMAALVRCLHASGHTRMGFLSWPYPVAGGWAARRFDAFLDTVRGLGIEFEDDWALNPGPAATPVPRAEIADTVAAKIRGTGVSAWVCAADHQAYSLIRELGQRGIRVPEDCSITGYDGLEAPPGLPRVTSMSVPHEHIGASALTRIINRIIYPYSPQKRILVEPQFVPGGTVAARPRR